MGYAYVAESEGKMKAYEGVNMKRQLLPEREVYIICSHKGVRANDFFYKWRNLNVLCRKGDSKVIMNRTCNNKLQLFREKARVKPGQR